MELCRRQRWPGGIFLDRYRADGITIRWRRGETMTYVLDGQWIGDHPWRVFWLPYRCRRLVGLILRKYGWLGGVRN